MYRALCTYVRIIIIICAVPLRTPHTLSAAGRERGGKEGGGFSEDLPYPYPSRPFFFFSFVAVAHLLYSEAERALFFLVPRRLLGETWGFLNPLLERPTERVKFATLDRIAPT
jgi:hypothetical protein